MNSRTVQLLLLCLVFLYLGNCPLKAANAYNAVEIDMGGNLQRVTFGADINNSGQVVICNGSRQCYLYKNGQLTTLNFPDLIYEVHINDNGQVIAQTGDDKSYLYTNGSRQLLNFSSRSINNQGVIAGTNFDGTAFIYQNGVKTVVPGVYGAYGINNNKDVVGSRENSQFGNIGYQYSNGSLTNLPTTGYRYYITAQDINDNGQIAGNGYYDLYHVQGFIYENGNMRLVGLLPGTTDSFAHDLNNKGQIVGCSADNNGKAFIYESGIIQNLTTMVSLPNGYYFSRP